MAEVAGLVLGIVGLIGTFRDTIDLFNDFMAFRNLGRDYEILITKVDIEKTILLQWVEHVKLLEPDYDKRLDDTDTQRAVARILGCIKLLMSDEAQLKHRYGLVEDHAIEASPRVVLGGHRMAKFLEEIEALKSRCTLLNKTTTLRKKVLWVIRDKVKFEELVKELIYFTTKLTTQIVPVFDDRAARNAAGQDVALIDSIRTLSVIFDASVGNRMMIAESSQESITSRYQKKILDLLWFRTITERKESISAAHSKTFHWTLHPPVEEYPWDDLSEWLLSGSGIYWISGKAGSGKSTLMKYLLKHPRTRRLLSRWAGGTPYLLVHFFFWNLGTIEQKSQEGLSRSLLYQILSANPSLIAEVLPNMWKQLTSGDVSASLPTVAETMAAFRILATKTSDVGRFCFFIDGLDEFAGNYLDGISFLKELGTNNHIKVLVSSRPIPDCVASFDGLPSLQLHNLTFDDITHYVADAVGSHKYMKGLLDQYPNAAGRIMEDIVNKSSGVFLWVILACRSLLSGFADHDRIDELQQRVDELPPELYEMFQHMLSKIKKRHMQQGARMLKIYYAYRQAQDGNEHDKSGLMNSLSLISIDEDRVNIPKLSKLTADQKLRLCEGLEGRLRSRTGGLLEIKRRVVGLHHNSIISSNDPDCFCDGKKTKKHAHNDMIDSTVEFMHRTVFEFLGNEQAWDLECLLPPEGFQVDTELSLIGLYSAMMTPPKREAQAYRYFREGLRWGMQSDLNDLAGRRNIFWVMQPLIGHIPSSEHDDGTAPALSIIIKANSLCIGATPYPSSHVALALAVEAGAINFVRGYFLSSQLDTQQLSFLLYHAAVFPLAPPNTWKQDKTHLRLLVEMISLVLSHGGDPNYCIRDESGTTTPWMAWLHSMRFVNLYSAEKYPGADIAKAFLLAGARRTQGFDKWVHQTFTKNRSQHIRATGSELLDLATRRNPKPDNSSGCSESTNTTTEGGEPDETSVFRGASCPCLVIRIVNSLE
ncbi:prion-inhibition and propagation-domain-containing protein [Hypomontagnella monticulosa]|nr:prion-inhibition and propagation-domain-containing protein [Hypomontagnella monticulosa]